MENINKNLNERERICSIDGLCGKNEEYFPSHLISRFGLEMLEEKLGNKNMNNLVI